MSFLTYCGEITTPTSDGDVGYTDCGFTPKLVLFYASPTMTGTGTAASAALCIGAADGTSQYTFGYFDQDAQTTGVVSYGRGNNYCCFGFCNATGTNREGVMKSFDENGFTITWSNTGTTQYKIRYIAFGGTDITNVKIASLAVPDSTDATGIEGVGFQPDALIFATASNSTSAFGDLSWYAGIPTTSYGFATSSSARGSLSRRSKDNVDPTIARRQQSASKAFVVTGDSAVGYDFDLVSMDADGFTIQCGTAPSSVRYGMYIAIKGGKWHVGSFNSPTSSGDQTISGLAVKPKALICATWGLATGADNTAGGNISIGGGISSSSRFALWSGSTDNVGDSVSDRAYRTTKIIEIMSEGTPTDVESADLKSLNNDGFTLTWTADGTAREILYLVGGESVDVTEQTAYRFYADDGVEGSATALALANTAISKNKGDNVRLRVQIDTTGSVGEKAYQLEVRKKGTDTWYKVE